jgi:hypothetical protein
LRRSQVDGLGKNGLTEIFGAMHSAGRVALSQHHEEFLTAIAADHIVGADGSAQPAGNFAKHVVVRGMTIGIVDGLEMVDVAHYDGGTVAFVAGAMNFAQEQLDNHAAIPKRSKHIVSGLEARALASRGEDEKNEDQAQLARFLRGTFHVLHLHYCQTSSEPVFLRKRNGRLTALLRVERLARTNRARRRER